MSFNHSDYFSASLDNGYVFMHNQVIGISNQAKATAIVVLVTFASANCLILSSIPWGNVY